MKQQSLFYDVTVHPVPSLEISLVFLSVFISLLPKPVLEISPETAFAKLPPSLPL